MSQRITGASFITAPVVPDCRSSSIRPIANRLRQLDVEARWGRPVHDLERRVGESRSNAEGARGGGAEDHRLAFVQLDATDKRCAPNFSWVEQDVACANGIWRIPWDRGSTDTMDPEVGLTAEQAGTK